MRTGTTERRTGIALLVVCCLAVLPLGAQKSRPLPQGNAAVKKSDKPRPGDRTIRVDVDLVVVNVTVTDPYNRLVTGLEQNHFRVLEDNVEQEVLHFSSEDVPVSIGLIFDMSQSMGYKVEKARLAALQFVKTANPQDEFFLIGFNDRAQLITRFTSSVEEVQSRLMYMTSKGRTALYDAVYFGLSQMKNARNTKRALLILSDGGDNRSRYNERDVRNFMKEADVQVYTVGIFEPVGFRSQPELVTGPYLLNDLAEMTGGRAFTVESLSDLPDIATKISMELRNQYVLGYKPSNTQRDGKWHKIRVKVKPQKGLPPLNVYAKTGYYAPKQ